MPSTSDRLYDANDLTQWVNERNANGLLGCTLEEDSTLHGCAFTLEGSIDLLKKTRREIVCNHRQYVQQEQAGPQVGVLHGHHLEQAHQGKILKTFYK